MCFAIHSYVNYQALRDMTDLFCVKRDGKRFNTTFNNAK